MATATKKPVETIESYENFTITSEADKPAYNGPMVQVYLPEVPGGASGVKVDQHEHVTISNEEGEVIWHVRRGMLVDVPVPVFVVLKEKYPNL